MPAEFDGWAGPLWNVLSGRGRTWQNCIYVLDAGGNLVEVWDQWDYLFEGSDGPGPHRIRVSPYDPERRIWIVHETAHQIFVLSNDGKELLRTFGEKNLSGTDETHFGLPQDVGFLPDGRVLIADGYENSRVMVLDADWNYLTEFGRPGDGPGEFQIVHSIAMAPGGRVLVADRDNNRIQIFSQSDYSYMGEIPTGALALDIIVSGNRVFVSDVGPPRLRQFDLEGNPVYGMRRAKILPTGSARCTRSGSTRRATSTPRTTRTVASRSSCPRRTPTRASWWASPTSRGDGQLKSGR